MKRFLQKLTETKKIRKAISVITAFLVICTSIGSVTLKAAVNDENPLPILKYENLKITADNQAVDVSNRIDELKNLEEGTIIARFKPNTDAIIMDLFSISDNTTENVYYALYVKPGTVGFEARTKVNGTDTHLGDINGSYDASFKGVNTVALKVDKDYGYKIFFNGKLVKDQSAATVHFFKSIANVNKAAVGKIFRGNGKSSWLYNGYIDFIDIYSQPLSDDYLLQKTGETNVTTDNTPLPEGVYKSEPVDLFYPGLLGSNNYRIPSLITTKKGNVIAGIDARIPHGGDSPNNIDSAVRISADGGKTWGAAKKVIDYPDSASTIDTSLLQDESTERVFLLVDGFPHGYGTFAAKYGTGYKEIGGKKYLTLYDASNNEYTVRENGVVFNNQGTATNYTVDVDNNVYQNGTKVGNTFASASPLKAFGTSYLNLIYSDDEGATWSKPIDLNPMVKKDWMSFLGTGPGRGLQLKNGEHAGRLIFPVYYLNRNVKQSSVLIYSDDHGATWQMGESPNDSRIDGSTVIDSQTLNSSTYELTESQVVEMPDGQLKLFCRNYGGKVSIATSFDGGETWDSTVVKDSALADPYCQMTAINYSQKIDGYDAIIFANPNASSRVNGTARIGLIKENGTYENGRKKYTFDWKYSKLVKSGTYAYSCLTELPNGNIGLFYEGTGSQQMSYTEMNIDYIKYNPAAKNPNLLKVELMEARRNYREGDAIGVKLTFDEKIIAFGTNSLTLQIGNNNVPLLLSNENLGNSLVFQGTLPSIPIGNYELKLGLPNTLEVFNLSGLQYANDGSVRSLGAIEIEPFVELAVPVISAAGKYSEVALTWAQIQGVLSYEIYRSEIENGAYTKVATSSSTTFSDSSVTSNKIYYYKVLAVDSRNNRSGFSNIVPAATYRLSYMLTGSSRIFDGTKAITGSAEDLNKIKDLRKGTVVMRFKTDGINPITNSIFSVTNSSATGSSIPELSFFLDKGKFRFHSGGGSKASITTTPVLDDGKWHTVMYISQGTEDNNGVDGVPGVNNGNGDLTVANAAYNRKWLIVDGVEYAAFPNLRKFFGDELNMNTLTIGGRVGGAAVNGTEGKFKGEIDYVLVTDKVFTAEEAKNMTAKEIIHFENTSPNNTWAFSGGEIANGTNLEGYRTYINHFQEVIRWENNGGDTLKYGRQRYVINASKDGDTAANIIAGYDNKIKPLGSKMVAVMAGLEDCQAGTEITKFKTDLTALVGKIREDGKVPVLMTPNPVLKDTIKTSLSSYVNAVKEIAVSKEVYLVDFYKLWNDQGEAYIASRLSADGILPNAMGHLDMGKQLANSVGSSISTTGGMNTIVTKFNDVKVPQYKYLETAPAVKASNGSVTVTLPVIPAGYTVDNYSYEINIEGATIYGSAAKEQESFTVYNLPKDKQYKITVSASLTGTVNKYLRYKSVSVSPDGNVAANPNPTLPELPADATGTVNAIKAKLASSNPVTWMFIGDSITHGAQWTYGYNDFTELFEKRVRNEMGRTDDIVINTGVSGATTTEFLNNEDSRFGRYKVDVAFVMLGMNDCVTISKEQFKTNLESIVDKLKAANVIPVLRTSNISPAGNRFATLPPFMEVVREIAANKNVLLIDHFKEWTEAASTVPVLARWIDAADGGSRIHPDSLGHLNMAQSIFKGIGIYDPQSELCTLDYSSMAIPNNGTKIVDNMTGITGATSPIIPQVQRSTNSVSVNLGKAAADYGSEFKNMMVEIALGDGVTVKGSFDPAITPNAVIYGISPASNYTVKVSGLISVQDQSKQEGKYIYTKVQFADAAISAVETVNKEVLNEVIEAAQAKYDGAIEGNAEGQYPKSAKDALLLAKNAAIDVKNDDSADQEKVDAAVSALNSAVTTFESQVISGDNKAKLNAAIAEARTKYDAAVVGGAVGQYPKTAKYALSAAINVAMAIKNSSVSTQTNVDAALKALTKAMTIFDNSVIKE